MGAKLIVGNLSFDVENADLEAMFGAHGSVRSAQVIMDRDTGRRKGFGFVGMGADGEAQSAISVLNGAEFKGRALAVNEAKPREDRAGGRSYGNGGGGGGSSRRY
jgi:RNA recognition motif-containing protein